MNSPYVPGPVYNHHDVCDASDYVCSFQHKYDGPIYDLYVATDGFRQQIVIWRHSGDHPSDYGASTFLSLMQAVKVSDTSLAIFSVLFDKGKFVWTKE